MPLQGQKSTFIAYNCDMMHKKLLYNKEGNRTMPEFIKMAEHRHFKAKISNSEMHVFDGIACFEIFLTTLIVNLISYYFEIIFNE